MKTLSQKKILTGVKPTGSSIHLGNLVGAVLPFGRLAEGNDAAIFIADLHALTSVKDGAKLRAQTAEVALEYFSIYGPDTPITIFRQSDIPLIPRLNWVLNAVTPYSLMLLAHSFKDFHQRKQEVIEKIIFRKGSMQGIKSCLRNDTPPREKNEYNEGIRRLEEDIKFFEKELAYYTESQSDLNMAVFNYPILMAADILAYDTDIVPVGRDQKQHLEMARDIARAFNKTYKSDVFKEPREHIEESVAVLPGLDGRKMSKSYDNFIGVFDDEKTLKKKIATIVTDSKGLDDPKDPETCNIFALAKVFASTDRLAVMREKYLRGTGYGYGHAKADLLEILLGALRPYHERREQLLKDPGFIKQKLQEGARTMNARIEAKMRVVSELVGI